jgi:hypothetical protein
VLGELAEHVVLCEHLDESVESGRVPVEQGVLVQIAETCVNYEIRISHREPDVWGHELIILPSIYNLISQRAKGK